MDIKSVLGIHAPFAEIVLRTVIVYTVILAGLRLTGRRQMGQMTPFDLVVILLISNAVQNAMVGPDVTILGGLVAAAVLLVLNEILEWLTEKLPFLRRAVEGEPVLLVCDGQLQRDNMRREKISIEEVLESVREHGFERITDVHLAYLEVDGTVSIVPADSKILKSKRVVRRRHRARASRPGGN